MVVAALIVISSVAAGVGLIVVMRRRAGGQPYFRDSGIAGGAFGAVRGPFAVLLAFVIFLAFQGYTGAREAARTEATSVLTMSRTADLLPPAGADDVQKDLVCYARAVVEAEWPAMQEQGQSPLVDLWMLESERAIGALDVRTPVEDEALAEFFSETNRREEARNERLSEADGVVPSPVWIVLILGGLMIVVYVSFFADPRERLLVQGVMIGTTVVVISSGLLLVAFFDHPYADRTGAIEPSAMASTLKTIEDERASKTFVSEAPCDARGNPQGGH